MSKALKRVAKIALPIAGTVLMPGIGTALGSALSSAALSGIGGALGGGLGGAIGGGGLRGALTGAVLGGAGGYLSGGGLSDLLSGTALGNSLNSASNSLGFGNIVDPAANAARSAVSSAATAATPSSGVLSGYLPTGGVSGAGGGTSGGFFKSLGDLISPGAGTTAGGLPVGQALETVGGKLTDQAISSLPLSSGFSGVPGAIAPTLADQITNKAGEMFTAKNLVGGLGKLALTTGLQGNNDAGYEAVQNASRAAAGGYAPFLASGTRANNTLADLYGLNGEDAAMAATQNWQNTPGFQFARDQGIKALDASAASRGMLRSGTQEQAVQQFGTDLASQYYQQYLQNLRGQQAAGLNAADGVGQNTVDAATAYALMKRDGANRRNQLLGGLSQFF